jgi:nicotinamide mononucleotide transporter
VKALDTLVEWFALTSPWEVLAVALALAYLLLAVKRSLWCWPCAFISSAIYVALMLEQRFYMQVALNVFYVAMAVYGFIEWRRHRDVQGEVMTQRWPLPIHVLVVVGVVAVSALNGWLLTRTDGTLPYVDAFITWGSVVTTWMVARRVLENWLYWIVVDSVAAAAYFHQGLRPTALLFVLYVGIVIRGYFVWLRESRLHTLAA